MLDVSKCLSAPEIIQHVGAYFSDCEQVSAEDLEYVLLVVLPRIYKYAKFEQDFSPIFELISLQTNPNTMISVLMDTLAEMP